MKKIDLKILIITSFMCLSTIILGVIFYNKLPERVAVHWGIDNNPNGYFSKERFVFGIPFIMVAIQIFCCIVNDLSDKHPEANKKAGKVFKWFIPIMTIVLYIVTLSYALGNNLDIRKIVMIILGIMFIVIGNYMPKTKGNTYMHFGKRVNDEKLLCKISKISGYIMIINGFLVMISILLDALVSIALIGLIVLEGILLDIYVYVKDKK